MTHTAPADTVYPLDARTKRQALITLWLGLLTYGVIWVIFSQLWIPGFTSGGMSGPYWLMIVFNIGIAPLAIMELLVAPLMVLLFPISRVPENRREIFRKVKGALIAVLMIAGVLTGLSGWYEVLQSYSHSETARIGGQVYQTAVSHDLFADQRPTVFQCDQFGFWCHRIYFLMESDTPPVAWTLLRAGEQPETLDLEICWRWPRHTGSSPCETKQILLTQGDLHD